MATRRRLVSRIATHAIMLAFGLVMVYPLVWLFFSAFKDTTEILTSYRLLPKAYSLDGFVHGWKGEGRPGFGLFLWNATVMTIPTVALTVVSGVLVAYGFTRFEFRLRKALFSIMIGTVLLPGTVLLIPRYLIFRNLGVLDSYLPFWLTAATGVPFFIFMFAQFLRGIPRSLDESAFMDGCGSLRILRSILVPLLKPAIFSATIFQFMWTWDDFFQPLIYLSSVDKYTVPLGLRMSIDAMGIPPWNEIAAMSVVSILPSVIIFFAAQKYFVEGIATTGLKG